jgi:hypothetical protein
VATRAVPPVDQDNPHVRMIDQRVSERHSGGTGTNDQVVGVDRRGHASYQHDEGVCTSSMA